MIKLTNESFKYLYLLLDKTFSTNEEDMDTKDQVWNIIEKGVMDYDQQYQIYGNDFNSAKHTYTTQLKNGATKPMLEATISEMQKAEDKQKELSLKTIEFDIPKGLCEFVGSLLRNLMKTNLLDEKMRKEGVAGREETKLWLQILRAFPM